MDPQWITAACAAVGLMITWSSTILGVGVWLTRRLDDNKRQILDDIEAKHKENAVTIKALHELVIRHDVMLDPEFNGSGERRPARRSS